MLRLICIVLCYVLFGLRAFCQNYEVQKLGVEQGLSNNYVVSITQDRSGYLWFATESGLNRFDGRKFTVFKKKADQSGISGNNLNRIFADQKDDYVYLATQRDGLNRINSKTGEIKHYKNDPKNAQSIVTNDITDIAPASTGGLWVATFSEGVAYFDRQKETFNHFNKKAFPALGSNFVWSVKEDNNRNLYIGHVDAGLSIIALQTRKVKNFRHVAADVNSLPSDVVRTIFVDNSDNVWIGTDDGLALYRKESDSFVVFKHQANRSGSLPSNSIYSITQLKDGKLCVGTEKGGLSFLDINKQMFLDSKDIYLENVLYSDDRYGLSNSTVRHVYEDSFGNIWLGTYGGGINFIGHRGNYFKVWSYSPIQTKPTVLSNPVVWGVTTDLSDNVWVGTDGGGINVFADGRRRNVFNKANGHLTSDAVIASLRDRDGRLYFGTFEGDVYVFNQAGVYETHFTVNGRSTDIRTFYQDDKGDILIGTTDGIYVYSPTATGERLKKFPGSRQSLVLVRAIAQDNDGHYYIGFFGQGVIVLDRTGNVIARHQMDTGLPSNTINHLFRDKKGRIWCATAEGLARFDGPKNITVVRDTRLKEQPDIRAIVADEAGDIWFSSVTGISKLLPQDNTFFHYDYHYGIPIGDFMSGSVTKDNKGQLYFGSQNGLCFFNPDEVPTRIALPETKITSFKVLTGNSSAVNAATEVLTDKPISLSYDQNTLDISFNILDYAISPLVAYSYMLDGLDDAWYEVEGNNIVFRNVPPGNYTLQIRSRVLNQDWSAYILTQKITIYPPIWWSWWAKSFYLLLLALVVWTLLRFYKRKMALENTLLLEKMNHQQEQDLHKERIRFFTNITHELKTPLTLILGPLEDMKQENDLSKKLKDKVAIIHKSAARLLGLVTQILAFQKIEDQNRQLIVRRMDIVNFIEDIAIKYKEYSLNRPVSFELVRTDQEIYMFFDLDVVGTILENLLSNAFKYTDEGKVTLTIKRTYQQHHDVVDLIVTDTGRGIPLDEQRKIFDRYYQVAKHNNVSGTGIGLALVKSLADIHDATIDFESTPGVGSSFVLRLRLDHDYPEALHMESKVAPTENHVSELGDDAKPIVLLVEDDDDIMDYILRMLSADYRILSARNGKMGLEQAYSSIPDIIVSDVMMPEMDGFQMSKALKSDLRTSHIPIILLTAKDSVEDRKEGYAIGIDSYLTKPFSASLLESRVLNLLKSRKKLANLLRSGDIKNQEEAVQKKISTIDRVFLDKVESIILDNVLSDKVDVVFLADRLHMSHSTLYRKVKGLTEMTVSEFIRKVKIAFAAQLLDTGKHTVLEVSSMVGMSSVAYFKQCFKEQFNVSATDYTKREIPTKQDHDFNP
ncbi:two-component regulator propeller domain-containing protein [Sphingobacterium oryzagri]|uniref:histidine kinase n=1 Tax=Sphingobacterium oryzagri TaxID=3025669 RepID=A0ABY7WDR9_9SPHI|nr:two-component regulator propeller domain-containing protein [Sphingobacterium sp. KACC 22765]WDF67020.1 two-component regulator propeller domain-containing protein [Sphingobacterium sp. KACC 22765]